MSDQEYNGWTNYETWAVGVELANDEGLYRVTRFIVGQSIHPGAALRQYVEGIAGSHDWDLGPVNWSELLDSVRDE